MLIKIKEYLEGVRHYIVKADREYNIARPIYNAAINKDHRFESEELMVAIPLSELEKLIQKYHKS